MKKFLIVLLVIIAIAVGGYAYHRNNLTKELDLANAAKTEEDWTRVRIHASRYVNSFPNNSDAILLLAEAYAKDPSSDSAMSVQKAITLLQKISEGDSNASLARLRESQLLFLEQGKAYLAEVKIRKAIELDKNSQEAYDLLWRILSATNRSYECEQAFLGVLETCKPEEKPDVLRNWFNSQYVKHKFNYPVDSMLGILAPNQEPNDRSELDRLILFRNSSTDSADAVAAVALWMHRHSDSKSAVELLQPFIDSDLAYESTLFVNCLTSIYFDSGEFQKAEAVLDRWPVDRRNEFYYLQWKGILAQDLEKDYARAIEFFEKSAKAWPGQSDVTVHFRMARCLERLGKNNEAEKMNGRVKELGQMMRPENLTAIQTCLNDLGNARNIEKISDFYKKLNRSLESSEWQKLMKP